MRPLQKVLAARQHGAISRPQALALDMTDEAMKVQLRSGRWTRLEDGLYVVSGSVDGRHRRLWIAILGGGQGAVLPHTTAAELYAILAPRPEIHVTVPNGAHHLSGPLRIAHQA